MPVVVVDPALYPFDCTLAGFTACLTITEVREDEALAISAPFYDGARPVTTGAVSIG